MLRRLYDWTMDLAAHKRASWGLSAVSFIESSVFPIPPDVLLIPMVLAERRKAWFYALLCTVASVLGGILGYGIGLFAFIAGITPFPYKVITILSGVAALNPVVFIVASILARGIRFFLVAGVLWKFGEPMREFIERRLGLLTVVFCALLVGGFVLAKFIIE